MQGMFRQGDVLIRKVPPERLYGYHMQLKRDEQRRIVLAHGEVTGHAHAIYDPGVIAYQFGNDMALEVHAPVSVVHEEHSPISLEPGNYLVTRQREWTEADESQQVAD